MLAAFAAALLGFSNPYPDVASLLDCLDGRTALVSAHRGGSAAGYPENALETFQRAVDFGPLIIETDVRQTRDGVLVLLHDETVNRTTNSRGRLRDLSWAEVERIRLKDWQDTVTPYRIPRLDTALEWARGRTLLQVEVKEQDILPAVLEAVRRADAYSYVSLVFYRNEDAVAAARLDPRITIHANVYAEADLGKLEAAGLPASRLNAWTGNTGSRPALWRFLDRRGVASVYGTLRRRDDAIAMTGEYGVYAELARQGVDILAVDHPDRALKGVGVERTRRALRACGVK